MLTARHGDEAIALCRGTDAEIEVLITDVVMPGTSGLSVVRAFRELRPRTKVICMSGYAEHAILKEGLLEMACAYVQKPFGPAVITRTVREVLDAPVLA